MNEDELIEKVAREMAGALGARVPYDMLPEDASQPKLADGSRLTKEVLLDGARAALAAIREAGCEVVPKEAPNAWLVEMVGDRQFLGDGAAKMWRQAYRAMLSASHLKGET
jgi:hypothetical protein